MSLRLLVMARNSPTFPAPGSWQKGEFVVARPDGHVWGNREGLPDFVRIDLTFANTPEAGWVDEMIQSDGGRRTIGLTNAEVDSVITAGGQRSYSSRGQFISRLEAK